jgi:replicative DNA helicase
VELKRRKSKKKQDVEISLALFKKLTSYIFSEYNNKSFLKKLRQFFNEVNIEVYTRDVDICPHYTLVSRYIEAVIDNSIFDESLVFEYLLNINDKALLDEVNEVLDDLYEIHAEEAVYVENEFIDRLNFLSLNPLIKNLQEATERFINNSYTTQHEILTEIKELAAAYTKSIHSRTSKILSIPELDFNDESFSTNLTRINKHIKNEKSMIKTGIKRLNKMLHGGYQPGRVYVYLGMSGGWKSGMLLNTALWATKYNPKSICSDQLKKPAYLYITQENDTEETMDRIYSYIGSAVNGKIIHDDEEILQRMSDEGIRNPDHHNLILYYRPKHTISAIDIENMVSEIHAGGEYEVKLIVHDYLKRLRPNTMTGDVRIDLGEATNDLSELAKALKIPIVTGNQLNREAYKVLLQSADNSNKVDLGKKASVTMQSESQLITENADCVIAINREYSKILDTWYLSFTDLKNRSSKTNSFEDDKYFAVPFVANNSMRLMEDYGTEEDFSVASIASQFEDYNPNEMDDDTSNSGHRTSKSASIRNKTTSIRKHIEDIEDGD